jgi:hypothetical protein
MEQNEQNNEAESRMQQNGSEWRAEWSRVEQNAAE